jgi:hypothetical protein
MSSTRVIIMLYNSDKDLWDQEKYNGENKLYGGWTYRPESLSPIAFTNYKSIATQIHTWFTLKNETRGKVRLDAHNVLFLTKKKVISGSTSYYKCRFISESKRANIILVKIV